MEEIGLLKDLAILMTVSGIVTVLFHRFRQPSVIGYILAGILIGPYAASLISDENTIRTMANLGLVLLMFSLGLHFNLRKLFKVGAQAFIAALIEISLMVFIGFKVGLLLGWGVRNSMFLGAILAISSTTIIIKTLEDTGKTREPFAQLILGMLIFEDILGIGLIALLSGFTPKGGGEPADLVVIIGRLAIFLTPLLIAGLLTIPKFLRYVARYDRDEMLLISVLGICFGISLLASELGYSVALGAFIAGTIVSEARESAKIADMVAPIRDMFCALFFVSVGMLFNPGLLGKYAGPVVIITLVFIAGKIVSCYIGTFVSGSDSSTSLKVGMGMSQIGEFSFIIAQLGMSLRATDEFIYPVAVAVSGVTSIVSPNLIRASDGLVTAVDKKLPHSLTSFLNLYHRWMEQFVAQRKVKTSQMVVRILGKLIFQITLNVTILTATFIFAEKLSRKTFAFFATMPAWTGGPRTLFWSAAMVISLPVLAHTFYKLKAISILLAEMGITRIKDPQELFRVRNIVSIAIHILFLSILGIWLIAVCIAILPPWPVLTSILLILGVLFALMWQNFIRLYQKAQISIKETFGQEHVQAKPPMNMPMLDKAVLETVEIASGSPAAGRLISELQLRSKTGASIVAMKRGEKSIVNPEPDTEILAGDKLLLLGLKESIEAAKKCLRKE